MSEIQFAAVLRDSKGEEMLEPGVNGHLFTLGRACEIALDASLESDQKEGLKPKLKRGRMIEEIVQATIEGKPLAFDSSEIELLKARIAATFATASFVRRLCLMLDPNTKE
jgi:hypothetical protein